MPDRIQEETAPVQPVAQAEAPMAAAAPISAGPGSGTGVANMADRRADFEAALRGPRIGAMVYQRLNRARAGR